MELNCIRMKLVLMKVRALLNIYLEELPLNCSKESK